jgi:hypothetical protein
MKLKLVSAALIFWLCASQPARLTSVIDIIPLSIKEPPTGSAEQYTGDVHVKVNSSLRKMKCSEQ